MAAFLGMIRTGFRREDPQQQQHCMDWIIIRSLVVPNVPSYRPPRSLSSYLDPRTVDLLIIGF